MPNGPDYYENYKKTVAMVLEGTVACSWLEKEMAREIEKLRAKITKADYLLTQGAPALALETLQQ